MTQWIWNAIGARIGWAIGEIVVALMAIGVVIVLAVLWLVWVDIRQRRCGHQQMRQMPSSPVYRCLDCGLQKVPEKVEQR